LKVLGTESSPTFTWAPPEAAHELRVVGEKLDESAARADASLGSWHPEQVPGGTAYSFFRFPWQHAVLFDAATGTVYHYITEVRS